MTGPKAATRIRYWLWWSMLALALSGCSNLRERLEHLQPPEVQLSHLALLRADLLNPVFSVGLEITNPNDEALHIEGADTVLELNGKTVAKGHSVGALELAPRQTSEVEVEASAKTLALARQLFQLEQDGQIDYTVAGHVQLTRWLGGLVALPFHLSGHLTREQLLREIEGYGRH